jgi:4-amino-4-deoxy-L-arabinose transferase-like glycosyltransferase
MKQNPKTNNRLNRAERIFLLCVVLLALAVRIAYHYEMRGNVLVEYLQLDEQFHDRWARAIAAGDVIGSEVFFRAPLYPYLLGALYAVVGHAPEVVRLLQHLLGVLTVVLVYILSRTLFGRRSAVPASLLAATYAVMISFEGRLLFDFPLAFLVLLWLTLVVVLADRRSWQTYALLGFLFGMICIMRPTFLALAPPLFAYIIWMHVKGKASIPALASALVVAFLVPILIVTARNALVGGDFVLVAAQGGINFYIGNNPQADGYSSSVPEAGGLAWENRHVEYIAGRDAGRVPKQSEVSAYWFARGMEFVRTEPMAFAQLLLKKSYLFWSHHEIANNLSYYAFARASTVLKMLPVGFWLVGPLGIAGAFLGWREPRARILVLFLALYCLITILFFVCDRFRLPVVPVLCVFAGCAVQQIVGAVRTRQWRNLARTGLTIAAGTILVNTSFVEIHTGKVPEEAGTIALAALESGDLAVAAEEFDRIAAADPQNFGARVNQGVALWGMGRIPEALSAFHRGIGGDAYLALLNIAHLHFNLQQTDSALVYAGRAIEARPYAPGGYIIAAKALLVQQKTGDAIAVLLAGRAACRDDFIYGEYLLAGLYMQHANLPAADSLYRRVMTQTARPKFSGYVLESEKARYGEDLATLHAKTLHALGRLFAIRQQLDSTETYLRTAAHLLPNKADVIADWGVSLLRLNRLEEADSVMQRAVSINPANAALWFNYATVLANKREYANARHAVANALALRPDFKEAHALMEVLEGRRMDGP